MFGQSKWCLIIYIIMKNMSHGVCIYWSSAVHLHNSIAMGHFRLQPLKHLLAFIAVQ